jgi:hypothetical protein
LLQKERKEATHTKLHKVAQLHVTTASQTEHNNSTRREHPKDKGKQKQKRKSGEEKKNTHTPLHIKTHIETAFYSKF